VLEFAPFKKFEQIQPRSRAVRTASERRGLEGSCCTKQLVSGGRTRQASPFSFKLITEEGKKSPASAPCYLPCDHSQSIDPVSWEASRDDASDHNV